MFETREPSEKTREEGLECWIGAFEFESGQKAIGE